MKKILVFGIIFGMILPTVGLVVAQDEPPFQEEGAMWFLWGVAPANLDAYTYPVMEQNGMLYRQAIKVETVFVPANTVSLTYSESILEVGKTYTLIVSGTAFAGDTIVFDAKYSITERIVGDTWTDLVSGYTSYGPSLLDLFVDGINVDWGPYNEDHVYYTCITGDGTTLAFHIYDIFPSNNEGELTVEVYAHP